MRHKIYSREVFFKNHRAILIGPALQCANQNSQYYLELKRTDLRDEYSVRFLLKGYHAVDDLIYLVNLRQFPACMLGVFAIENTACRLTKKADAISIKFKDFYAVQYGRESVSFYENFEQDALIYCYPDRLFKAISQILTAKNKKPLFVSDRDDWLFPIDSKSAGLGNSFLTSNYISRHVFNSDVFRALVRFQKDLIQSGTHEGRHPGFYESSCLYQQVKKELSHSITGLMAKVDYLFNYVDDENYCDYEKSSELIRFAFGLEHQAKILSGNLFNENDLKKGVQYNDESEIVQQRDSFNDIKALEDAEINNSSTNRDESSEAVNNLFIDESPVIIGDQTINQGVVCQIELTADNTELSSDIIKKLHDVGFIYVEQLKGLSQDELCEYRGIGVKTAEKILKAISKK